MENLDYKKLKSKLMESLEEIQYSDTPYCDAMSLLDEFCQHFSGGREDIAEELYCTFELDVEEYVEYLKQDADEDDEE